MIAPVELIATHTGTGASTILHTIGREQAGRANNIADLRRIIQVSGIAGGSIVRIQGSITGDAWFDITSDISADTMLVMEDGTRLVRSICNTFGTGTISVYAQKFLTE